MFEGRLRLLAAILTSAIAIAVAVATAAAAATAPATARLAVLIRPVGGYAGVFAVLILLGDAFFLGRTGVVILMRDLVLAEIALRLLRLRLIARTAAAAATAAATPPAAAAAVVLLAVGIGRFGFAGRFLVAVAGERFGFFLIGLDLGLDVFFFLDGDRQRRRGGG
ncbi:MAG: hypothetical protein KIT76_17850, partial [Pseudolabrys sp.]|nr:hypothetical protein [Pseudolabrys sp.]